MNKKTIAVIAAIFVTATLWAQSPEKINYQAVVRDGEDKLVANQPVGMQISILQGSANGTAIYVETQTPTTNANGLISIQIGNGTTTDNFSAINWANGPFYLKTETDPEGGTNYTITGTSQLISVPYAMHAKSAETVSGGINETDPVYSGSEAAHITATDITNLGNLSGVNTGDQDISGIANNEQAIQDTASQIRGDIPDVPTGTQSGEMQYWDGTAWVTINAADFEGSTLVFKNNKPQWQSNIYEVTSATGKTWMDRNLGALQAATASDDAAAYGDLYQWGRAADGHESRTSGTTSTLSNNDTPEHGDFITSISNPYDWRNPQNDNLWQGVDGTNNPCPSGYRLPTEAEWDAERTSWSSENAAGAFASPLKLPVAGDRLYSDGSLGGVGFSGAYWSSTVDGTISKGLYFNSSEASINNQNRAYGFSVRCIKD